MADKEWLEVLRQGTEVWSASRKSRDMDIERKVRAEQFSSYNYPSARIPSFVYDGIIQSKKSEYIDLTSADLGFANLTNAELSRVDLTGANLSNTNLRNADLNEANLTRANLTGAELSEADLGNAILHETVLANLDLSNCKNLDRCRHRGPSIIDHRTFKRSGPLPLVFLHGIGLPNALIDYLPSQPLEFYSCFISYSSKDQAFAGQLHADLQAKGVRCWFAPHDMRTGAKILDAIDEAIRGLDKVLLVLSKRAIDSDWVEGEVTRALDEERKRKQLVLLPIRIDNTVFRTEEAWARLLQGQRNIGDFTRWKQHYAYSQGLKQLLRDLEVEAAAPLPAG
jgi:hypothetical protein